MAPPAWAAMAAAGIGAAGSIGGAILSGKAQQDALQQAGAQQNAALRQQIGISNQQMELSRPLLNVRDGVLGILAQRYGVAPPRPSLVRSQAEGTALVPVPGVTYKDNAKGSSDPRTPVFFDPVGQNFTTQTGAVIAPMREGIIPGLTQGKNNTVEVRNGQIRGLGNSGSVNVMRVPPPVAGPSAQQPVDSNGNPLGMTSGGQYTGAGGAPVGPQSISLRDFVAPQQNVNTADLRQLNAPAQSVNGVSLSQFAAPGQTVSGVDLGRMNAGPQGVNSANLQQFQAPDQNVRNVALDRFGDPSSRSGGALFSTARDMIGQGNASGVTNADVAALVSELRGMTGQDQLDFERAEAERGLERLANSRGLRNSGRELAALRERDVNVVGQRQDQRIQNALQVAGLAANRADTGFAQTATLADFLGGRDDVGFNQGLTRNQVNNQSQLAEANFAAGREDQAFNRGLTANQANNQTALAGAQFAAGREDQRFNRDATQLGLNNAAALSEAQFGAGRDDQRFNQGLAANQANNQTALSQAGFNASRDDQAFQRALAGTQLDNQTAMSLAQFAAGREDQLFNRALQENALFNQNRLTEAQFGANRADQEIANLFTLAGLGASGTNVAFNAGANLGNAYGNAGNNLSNLSVAGGNAQANMYGGIANGLNQGLFDFAMLGGFAGQRPQSVANISSQQWRTGDF